LKRRQRVLQESGQAGREVQLRREREVVVRRYRRS
jgi:hypothetical protein